jgi:fructose-1,6-bisphosphatase I
MIQQKITVLDEFIITRQKDISFASGDLSKLLRDIGLAAKIVNREVNKAGLVDILGVTDFNNVHGEIVKKLDIYANEQLIKALRYSGKCCGLGSEENENIIVIDNEHTKEASYVVLFDPLDGSSNIDVNVSIGTIFSIFRRKSLPGEKCDLNDFLQTGTQQVAAGYIIYGSSTVMVYTTGNGVNGFTLDPSIGEFCLSHPNISIPKSGKTYSINQGYFSKFETGLKKYISYCQENAPDTNRPYSLRYIGSFVADFHRNLINGGIFMYPRTLNAPNGKLRLLYECNPLSFIVEQAGGKASDGNRRILDIMPTELHQRTPVYIGSEEMVTMAEQFLEESVKKNA